MAARAPGARRARPDRLRGREAPRAPPRARRRRAHAARAALAYARDAAARPDPPDRRKALGLLAEALDAEGVPALARHGRRRRLVGAAADARPRDRARRRGRDPRRRTGIVNCVPFSRRARARAASRRERRSFAGRPRRRPGRRSCSRRRSPRGTRTSTSAVAPAVRSGDMIVLDLSASISSDTSQPHRRDAAPARRDSNGRYGLVVFSNVAYEALPPGTPASALRPLVALLHAPDADGPGRGSRPSRRIRGRVASAAARDLGRARSGAPDPARRTTLGRSRGRAVSDLADDPEDVQRLNQVRSTEYGRSRTPLRVVALNAAPDDAAFFARIADAAITLGPGARGERAVPAGRVEPGGAFPTTARPAHRRDRVPARGERASGRHGCAGAATTAVSRRLIRVPCGSRSRRSLLVAAVVAGAASRRTCSAGGTPCGTATAHFASEPRAAAWHASTRLPFDPARALLGLDDQLALPARGTAVRRGARSRAGLDNGCLGVARPRRARGGADRARAQRRTPRARSRPTTCSGSSPSPTRSRPGRPQPAPVDRACRRLPVRGPARPGERRREVQPRAAAAAARRAGRAPRRRRTSAGPSRTGTGARAARLPGRGY